MERLLLPMVIIGPIKVIQEPMILNHLNPAGLEAIGEEENLR
jgi:hypothetical protein